MLDFHHEGLHVTNAEFLRCIDILSKYIPDEGTTKAMPAGQCDHIRFWTDQILGCKRSESLAAVSVIAAIAHAYESVAKLPGSEFLIREIPRHQAVGLFDQLLVTHYLSSFISVTAVEQDKNRVDIVADVGGKRINIHVKGIEPFTKNRAQFEAFGHLMQAKAKKPIIDTEGKSLEVINFNGYIPGGVKYQFWEGIWELIAVKRELSTTIVVPGGIKESDSLTTIDLQWVENVHGHKGKIGGINAFQQALNRINDVNDKIPNSSQDIEFLILISQDAKYLTIGGGVLPKRRLDGVRAISVNPGSLGYHFTRSNINLKSEYQEVSNLLEQSLPESVWLCNTNSY